MRRSVLAARRVRAARLWTLAPELDPVGPRQASPMRPLADLVNDPLADITELERIKFVMKGGRVVRSDLNSKQ